MTTEFHLSAASQTGQNKTNVVKQSEYRSTTRKSWMLEHMCILIFQFKTDKGAYFYWIPKGTNVPSVCLM